MVTSGLATAENPHLESMAFEGTLVSVVSKYYTYHLVKSNLVGTRLRNAFHFIILPKSLRFPKTDYDPFYDCSLIQEMNQEMRSDSGNDK